MPAATTKSQLLKIHSEEYFKLIDVIEDLDQDQAELSLEGEDSTIKSVIHHRTEWMKMFINWYQDGLAGKEVFVPAKGYKWNQLKEYNAMLWEKFGQSKSWETILDEFRATYKDFIALMNQSMKKTSMATVCFSGLVSGQWVDIANQQDQVTLEVPKAIFAKYSRKTSRFRSKIHY